MAHEATNIPEEDQVASDQGEVESIDADNEKSFFRGLKKKNKGFLVSNLTILEKERIAGWIKQRIDETKTKQTEMADKMDKWDETFRMKRTEVIGSDGDMPNYRSPLTTVTHEVIHANLMNVFFTPTDLARALPTEEGDIPKVENLNTFMNWSVNNELDIFTQIDRLWHSSEKNGEAPYLVHWVKEYGTEIKRKILTDPANPGQPLFDPDTQEPLFQEEEERKLLYNGPRIEVFSRKDYIQPNNALMDQLPDWEAMKIRRTRDWYLREELQGNMYADSIDDITDWRNSGSDTEKIDAEGDQIPLGNFEQEFVQFYGRLRINLIKDNDDNEADEFEELEDEFIAIVHLPSETLCQLRVNKFPLKMRPIGIDYFIPDDEGRRAGIGIYELMESQQTSYDALYNQFVLGVIQSNNPIVFETPLGNRKKESTKLRHGRVYHTRDPQSVQIFQFPPPNVTIQQLLEMIKKLGAATVRD